MGGLHAEKAQPGIDEALLSAEAVEFLHALHCRFAAPRRDLLAERLRRQQRFDRGEFPELLPGADRRQNGKCDDWTVAPIPGNLVEPGVMITGAPGEALSGGLQSGASIFVADFDDCSSPVWTNCLKEHDRLRQANGRRLVPRIGGTPSAAKSAVLCLRPRNWLLEEKHFSLDGTSISAALFDFGLYLFHNAATLLAGGNTPCFSLPKLESPLEARLWNNIFAFSEVYLGFPHGSIRALVTIETLSAAFAMEEILFELRGYAFALACSPSNYLSSYIQTLRAHSVYLLPQCSDLSMEQPFLHAYRELLVHTCHKRGAYAIGECYPQFPVYDVPRGDRWAKTTARLNAMHEVEMGFDGTSVGRADLVPTVVAAIAEQLKDRRPTRRSQEPFKRRCYISSSDLIARARGRITTAAVEENVAVALRHLGAWLSGQTAVYRGGRRATSMATAELCRAQLWQWIRHSARMTAGPKVDRRLVESLIRDYAAVAAGRPGSAEFSSHHLSAAGNILLDACADNFESPLATHAYAHIA